MAAGRNALQPNWFMQRSAGGLDIVTMFSRIRCDARGVFVAASIALLFAVNAHADDSNRAKARALVNAAIQMTDSEQALKLLWQATDIDHSYNEAYVYLGL